MPRLSLKNVKSLMTHDGMAYTATLYLDGAAVGTVEQGGHGGCNLYHFTVPEAEAIAEAEALAWGADRYGSNEILDLYVSHLLDEIERMKIVRRNAKRGFPVTVFQFQGKDDFGWQKEWAVGVKDESAVPFVLAHHKCDHHEVRRLP